jgi:hypothetical protein
MIPNENQSPNVTNNNNSKEFPLFFFFFPNLVIFPQKIRIFPFSFLFFSSWKKNHKKKSYQNGLKQPKTIHSFIHSTTWHGETTPSGKWMVNVG